MDVLYGFWKGGTKAENNEASKIESKEKEGELKSSEPSAEPSQEAQTPLVDEISDVKPLPTDGEISGMGSSQKAYMYESAKSIGTKSLGFLYSVANKAGKSVSDTAKHLKHTVEENTLLADFNKEQEAFLKSKSPKEAGCAPWVGCTDEESVKLQIISLSQDKRNFVRSPPTGVQFDFNFEEIYPVAMAVLAEDKNLEAMRFELVPKMVTEENFWRNYFYRVSLVKQSNQLSSMTKERGSSPETDSRSSEDLSSDESVKAKKHPGGDDDDTPLDSPSHEFVSDAYGNSNVSAEDIKQGMKQLGVTSRAGHDEEWEKELQQELQEYEVVAQQGDVPDVADWEHEMEDMLDSESAPKKSEK